MKRLGRPNLQGSADLDVLLIDVGAKLFKQQGFDGTSMDQVASVAGVSKHSLYRRYPDKDALFSDVFTHLFRENKARWLQLHHGSLKREPSNRRDALVAFKSFAQAIFDFSTDTESLAFIALFFQEKHRVAFLHDDIAELATSQNQEIMRHIKVAQEAGVFKKPVSTDSTKQLMALISSWPMIDFLVGQNELALEHNRNQYFHSAWESFVDSKRV